MNRIDAHGLKIAPVLFDFIAKEATPKTGISPDAFWAGLAAIVAESGAEESRTARGARHAAGEDRRLAPRPQGQAVRHERLYGLPQGDRLSAAGAGDPEGRDRQCRRGDRQDLRAAAGGAAHQRALRAERRQRALGQPVRCALRHRRDPARGRRRRQGLQQGARRQGDRQGQGVPRPAVPLATGSHTDVTSYSVIAGAARGQTEERQRHRAEDPTRSSPAISGDAAAPSAILLVNNGMHVEIKIDRSHIDRQGRSGRRRRRGPGIGGLAPSWTGRQRRRRRCRRQGAGLSQLARPDERHAVGRFRKGRQDAQARAQSRPRLHRRPTARSSRCTAAACC